MPPTVSVLMPVYNAERYVATAIESILGQSFGDFEFVIVDDGSTDRSLQIIRSYERHDPRIRVLVRPHTGIVIALNEGLSLARGDLIARMDADDIAHPQRLARQVAYLDDHPECVAVGAQVRCIDGDGAPVLSDYRVPLNHAEIHENWHLRGIGGGIPNPTAVVRCAALEQIGGYREVAPAEDHDLFLRLAEVGLLANVAEVLLDYRVHPESSSHVQRQLGVFITCAMAAATHRRCGTSIPLELRRRWAGAAIELGEFRVARRQACLGLAARPFSRKSWRMLGRSVLGGFLRRPANLRPKTGKRAA